MSTPWGRDYYDTGKVNLQTREGVTMDKMDKMNQVDKMAIMATMAKMAFQLDRSACLLPYGSQAPARGGYAHAADLPRKKINLVQMSNRLTFESS